MSDDLDKYLDPAPRTKSRNYDDLIERHARDNQIDPNLIRAIMHQESGGKSRATSHKGASGLMQLMPGTAARFGTKNIYDPDENIRGGARYLKFLNNRFKGDTDLVLAGYNAGEGAVEKFGNKIPPYKETRNYVPAVKARYQKLTGGQPQKPAIESYVDPLENYLDQPEVPKTRVNVRRPRPSPQVPAPDPVEMARQVGGAVTKATKAPQQPKGGTYGRRLYQGAPTNADVVRGAVEQAGGEVERREMEANRPKIDALKQKFKDFAPRERSGRVPVSPGRIAESMFSFLANTGVQAGNLVSSDLTREMRFAQQALAELDAEDPDKGWLAAAERSLPAAAGELSKMYMLSRVPVAGRATLPALGALSEADRGVPETVKGAAIGELYHRGFGAMSKLPKPAQFAVGTAVPAGVAVAQGQDYKSAILENTAFGAMALAGGRKPRGRVPRPEAPIPEVRTREAAPALRPSELAKRTALREGAPRHVDLQQRYVKGSKAGDFKKETAAQREERRQQVAQPPPRSVVGEGKARLTESEIVEIARRLQLPVEEVREAASLSSAEINRRFQETSDAYTAAVKSGQSVSDIAKAGLDTRAGLYQNLAQRAAPQPPEAAAPKGGGQSPQGNPLTRQQQSAKYVLENNLTDERHLYLYQGKRGKSSTGRDIPPPQGIPFEDWKAVWDSNPRIVVEGVFKDYPEQQPYRDTVFEGNARDYQKRVPRGYEVQGDMYVKVDDAAPYYWEQREAFVKGGTPPAQSSSPPSTPPAQPLKPEPSAEANPPLPQSPQKPPVSETPASSTSARKAQFAEDRAELDLPELPPAERKSWRQSLSEAKPETADRLAEEVLRKPRALNDSETASIVVRAQQVKNEHAAKMKEVYEATDAEAIAAKRVEAEVLEAEFDKLTQAAKASGTEKARTLAAQKLTINQDFDLVSVKARMKAAKGRPLTEKENARYEDMVRQRDQAIVERDAALEKARVQQIDREIQRVSRQRKRAETKEALDEEAAVIRQNIAAEFARIKSAQNIQASGLAGLDPEGVISKNLLKYARNRVKANVGIKAEQLIDDVHSLVKDFVDRRQVAELISGYKLALSEKQAEDVRRLSEIRSEIKSLLKQEDVAAGRITEKAQGVPRQIFSRNAQRLKQLQKQEAELTRRIEEGDFSKRTRPEPLPYTRDVQRAQERVTILENQFKREAERARPGHQLRNVSGVWKAWLLSSPSTHAMNTLGTGSYQAFREASRLPAAIADAVWSGARKTFGYGAQRSIQGPSPSAMLDSVLYAGKVGGREAMETLRMGAPREVMERHQYQEIDFGVNTGKKAIDNGVKAIELAHNMVFRLMSASDRVFYQGAYRRNLLDRAAMQAKNEGLKGREVTRRAEELAKEPSTEMDADAKHDALVSTFNNNNFLSQRIRQARAARVHSKLVSERGAERINAAENLALDLVLPFERTPTNVLSRIVEASPAGYLKNAGQLIAAAVRRSMSQEHQRQFMQTFGNATTGTALMALGWFVGDSLIDVEGYNVYLKIPGLPRINLRTASPVGNIVAMGARLRKNYEEGAEWHEYAATVGREATNQPLLRATSTITDLGRDPKRFGPRIGARYAASAIPFSGAVRFAAQTSDPEAYPDPSFKEQFQQNIPIWRNALQSTPRRRGGGGRPTRPSRTSRPTR